MQIFFWPDGLNAIQAKLLINDYINEWENNKNKEVSVFSTQEQVDNVTHVGDPNLPPTVYSKEVKYTTHKPSSFALRNKKKFIYGESYDQDKTKQQATSASSSGEPLIVPATQTSLDDSDLSLSESDVT